MGPRLLAPDQPHHVPGRVKNGTGGRAGWLEVQGNQREQLVQCAVKTDFLYQGNLLLLCFSTLCNLANWLPRALAIRSSARDERQSQDQPDILISLVFTT